MTGKTTSDAVPGGTDQSTRLVEVQYFDTHEIINKNISALPFDANQRSFQPNEISPKLEAGARIKLSSGDFLTVLSAEGANKTEARPHHYYRMSDEDANVIDSILGSSADTKACVTNDPYFLVSIVGDMGQTLIDGYFTLQVTHRDTTEETSKIYYYKDPGVTEISEFLRTVKNALEALANVDSVAVVSAVHNATLSGAKMSNYYGKTLRSKEGWRAEETKFFVTFFNTMSKIDLSIKERKMVQFDESVRKLIPQHNGYVVTKKMRMAYSPPILLTYRCLGILRV